MFDGNFFINLHWLECSQTGRSGRVNVKLSAELLSSEKLVESQNVWSFSFLLMVVVPVLMLAGDGFRVRQAKASQPKPLTEPRVKVSLHTAPLVRELFLFIHRNEGCTNFQFLSAILFARTPHLNGLLLVPSVCFTTFFMTFWFA